MVDFAVFIAINRYLAAVCLALYTKAIGIFYVSQFEKAQDIIMDYTREREDFKSCVCDWEQRYEELILSRQSELQLSAEVCLP